MNSMSQPIIIIIMTIVTKRRKEKKNEILARKIVVCHFNVTLSISDYVPNSIGHIVRIAKTKCNAAHDVHASVSKQARCTCACDLYF